MFSNTKAINSGRNNASSRSSTVSLFSIVMIGIAIIIVIFFIYSTYTGYKNYTKSSPYLIDGITDATVPQQFSAYQVPPSSSSKYGTEFSYSFWLFIKDTNFNSTSTSKCSGDQPLLHVFHKGSYDYAPSGSTGSTSGPGNTYYPLLQMPGVWLYPNTNKLNIRFNTYENVVESADVGNIPLNMWVNVIIILVGGSVDVYINGNLKKRTKLAGVPKINYGNLYTTNWGGFNGYLSRLRYFNYAIQPFLVDQLFQSGPSKEFATNITQGITDPSAVLAPDYWMTVGFPNTVSNPGYNQSLQSTT
jgi:hypothetical protein